MVILNVSQLNNNYSAGININIPKFTKYLSNFCDSAYLDLGSEKLKAFDGFNNYFRKCDYDNFSIDKLPEPFNNPDIVVFQSFYIMEMIPIMRELIKKNIPYTIVPRCAMTRGAQNSKKLKKRVANILYFNKFVKKAKFIHFLTDNEYEESKNSFCFNDKVIIGNGIEIPNEKYKIKKRKEKIITFVGRYNVYHKGLDVLLSTINSNKEWFKDNHVYLHLYGSNSDNGLEFIEKYVSDNELDCIVKINDAVFGSDKEKVLLNADYFIHTSRLEGHPTSVIEAISYGIPVIVTPGTNVLENVKKFELGFICDFSEKSIFEAIKKAIESNDLKRISNNEIKYANLNYDWNNISHKIIDEYSHLLK